MSTDDKDNRRIIECQLESNIDLEGLVLGVIDRLKAYHEKYHDHVISIDKEYYYDYSQYNIVGKRLETDGEYQTRLDAERKKEEEKLERKRKRDEKSSKTLQDKIAKLEKELKQLKGEN